MFNHLHIHLCIIACLMFPIFLQNLFERARPTLNRWQSASLYIRVSTYLLVRSKNSWTQQLCGTSTDSARVFNFEETSQAKVNCTQYILYICNIHRLRARRLTNWREMAEGDCILSFWLKYKLINILAFDESRWSLEVEKGNWSSKGNETITLHRRDVFEKVFSDEYEYQVWEMIKIYLRNMQTVFLVHIMHTKLVFLWN